MWAYGFPRRKTQGAIRDTRSRIQGWRKLLIGKIKIWAAIPKRKKVGEAGQQGQIPKDNLVSYLDHLYRVWHWMLRWVMGEEGLNVSAGHIRNLV